MAAPDSEQDPLVQRATSELGAALAAQGRAEEAEPLLKRSAEWALAIPREDVADPRGTREVVERLIDHYESSGDAQSAEAWRSRLADWDR